jgi:hypothetical protein
MTGGVDPHNLIGSVDAVGVEEDSNWNATLAINTTSGYVEVKVNSDASNITRFAAFVRVYALD